MAARIGLKKHQRTVLIRDSKILIMVVNEKVKLAITVASLVAVTVLLAAEYRRRRRKPTSSPSSCYLHSETKPQFGFKRVLADNSYSGFKHLKKKKLEDGGGFNIS